MFGFKQKLSGCLYVPVMCMDGGMYEPMQICIRGWRYVCADADMHTWMTAAGNM